MYRDDEYHCAVNTNRRSVLESKEEGEAASAQEPTDLQFSNSIPEDIPNELLPDIEKLELYPAYCLTVRIGMRL